MSRDAAPSSRVFWYGQHARPISSTPTLEGDERADVIVVGGGMAGLSCAEKLADLGASVVLVEKEFCGAGASGKTSGFITPDSELELSDLIRNRGPEKAKELWEFVCSGVEHIRHTVESHRIDCDYQVQDSLFIANSRKSFSEIQDEHHARILLGYASTLYDAHSIGTVVGSKDYAGGVRYPGTFGINSYLYCQGLKDSLRTRGVRIFENSPVTRITPEGVRCGQAQVKASKVVVCTDCFLPELGIAPLDIYHVQTFLSISKPLTDTQVRTIFPGERFMVWDSDLIYQYFRVTGDNRLLCGAASMLYTYDRSERLHTNRMLQKMQQYLQRKFPSLHIQIESIWPGLLGVTKDFVPLASQDTNHRNVYYIGGAAGLPWAAALGRYMAEKVRSGRSDLDSEFTPERSFPIGHIPQRLLGTRLTFALSHGIAKYFR